MKDAFESLGRVRVQGLLLLALAFGSGVLGGMALERVRAVRAWRAVATRGRPDMGPMGAGRLAFFERLGITDAQREQIRAILESSRPLTDSILQSSMPRLSAIHDSVRAEIRAVLTPEQQEQFDELEGRWGIRGGPGEWGGRGGPRRGTPPDGGPPGGGPPRF
ncbi:MAG: hypothetical protein OEW06_04195 [Gemmatimonadota bacterium]|nr:hypothetical protein [Gemmatimonadota bacterium]MDH4351687.1 hypothetical protein [Gemmatimonadota bacterium]